jgi:hypothetical protein
MKDYDCEDSEETISSKKKLSEKERKEQARLKTIAQQEAKIRQAKEKDHTKFLNPMV